ncbi:MAG TPA: DUF1097 family protein [Syntrophomonadaceae bacterium]|nr:DUF1097 family protein [Syntrophomonadaceae bacterium]
MNEKQGFKKETLIAAVVIAAMVVVTLVVLGIFKVKSGWPAFLTLLFFFESGAKTENLKNIFCGAVVGLLLAGGLPLAVKALVPSLGLEPAILLVVFIIIFLIVALGDVAHMFFNNYAFVYFTVASIFPKQSTLEWIVVAVLGGMLFTGGSLGLLKLLIRHEGHES